MRKQLLGMLFLAATLRAQPARRGQAFDSLHGRALRGAVVTVDAIKRQFVSDSLGRIEMEGIPSGRYRAVIQHDILDLIGLNAVGADLIVRDTGDFVVAIPSFSSLWRLACAGPAPAKDSGLLFGTVAPPAGRRVSAGAEVQAFWLDVRYDKKAGLTQKRWVIASSADSTGNFALCGVPTTTGLVIRARLDSTETSEVEIPPMDSLRIFRKDLVLMTAAQSNEGKDRGVTLRVLVSDSAGAPISNVEVGLDALGLSAKTSSDGKALIANVRPGSHLVSAKAIGYAPEQRIVDFGAKPFHELNFKLTHITLLDSIRVTAVRAADVGMLEFAEHQKRGFGTFITRDRLAKLEGHPLDLALNQAQGATFARGFGGQAWIMSKNAPPLRCPKVPAPTRITDQVDLKIRSCWRQSGYYMPEFGESQLGMKPGCYSSVYLDRVLLNPLGEPVDLNSFPVSQIEAVEWFTGRTQVPIEYARVQSPCGVVILHRRR